MTPCVKRREKTRTAEGGPKFLKIKRVKSYLNGSTATIIRITATTFASSGVLHISIITVDTNYYYFVLC